MRYATCCVPVSPMRKEPDHASEMISQILFGEHCTIFEIEKTKGRWAKISSQYDGYVGWCQHVHVLEITKEAYEQSNLLLAADWINAIEYKGQKMILPFGSSISDSNATINTCWPSSANTDAATITKLATTYLNTTYLWGGRTVFGVDCSGFTQMVYKFLNLPLLRDAHQQATQGKTVDFLQQAQCGDLAFFDNEEGKIIHVGLLLSNAAIIHASGKVRIDNIDNSGIINSDTGERMQQLRIIKRYL
jgi:gamma-D-glutamyl-L-lysine dipeptidyl-peptidase